MSLAVNYTPEPLFSRRAHKRHMARTAKAFSAISMGAAFVLTSGEAFAQSSRASAENGFSPLEGQPIGFNEAGDLRVMLASGEEITIPRGEYGLVGDQIMVSDMIDGVEVAQNGYIPPTSDAYPVYGNTGPFGNLGMGTVLIPLGLILGGILVYFLIVRANNDGPAFGAASYSANFDENDTGTVLTVTAVDAEGDTFSYSLSGADAESFSIDASGNITFTDTPNFDAPGSTSFTNTYTLNAVATDSHGEATSVPVSITVTDDSDGAAGTADAAYNGDATAEDIQLTAAATGVDMEGGSDTLDLQAGVAAAGTVDMGSGNDALLLSAVGIGAGATINLGDGNDVFEIDVDTGGDDFTINLGAGDTDKIDIDAAQSDKDITVTNFNSGDTIDVSDSNTYTYDATVFGSAALAEAGAAADEITSYYDAGTGDTHVFFNDGGVIMEMILQDYSGFSANDLAL